MLKSWSDSLRLILFHMTIYSWSKQRWGWCRDNTAIYII